MDRQGQILMPPDYRHRGIKQFLPLGPELSVYFEILHFSRKYRKLKHLLKLLNYIIILFTKRIAEFHWLGIPKGFSVISHIFFQGDI